MASFYIPLSGLNADSTALNTIANNLSNMNTTGFKSKATGFSDLFYQQVGTGGDGDAVQVGGGTQVAANITDFTQGSINSTGVAEDVALNGNGFFVVNDQGTNLLTRAGDFTLTSNGDLVTADGQNLMGYQAVNGAVNTNSPLTAINIPENAVELPKATSTFGMTATLNSSSPIGTSVPAQVQVYDSLGQNYEANVTYTKTGTNAWSYSITLPDTLQPTTAVAAGVTTNTYNFGTATATVDPGTNLSITGPTATGTGTIAPPVVTPGETVAAYATALQAAITAAGITGTTVTSTAGGQLNIVGTGISTAGSVIQDPVASANAAGNLLFNSSGNLVSPAANVNGISFTGLSDGAAPVNMTWDLLGTNGAPTISQVDATSAVAATTQNGYPSGEYQSFAISGNGTVTATYSNGQTQIVGQLALANVANLQGLQDLGNSNYATTLASGTASVGLSGTNGIGTLTGGALEESNVNISAEFSDLIIAQRAFEANSKAVTTFDSVTEETINMIH